MYPNPMFRNDDRAECLAMAAEVGFGMLAVCEQNQAPVVAHLPFTLGADGQVEMHLVRSNPIARLVRRAMPATLAVQGPHGYISPDWYGIEDQVPTWNYVAVQMSGALVPLPQEALRGMLDRLSDHFEARLHPKPVWKTDKMPGDVIDRMMRMIQPYELRIETVKGTWKLGQNKSPEARGGAADGLSNADIGAETAQLAALMRAVAQN